MTHRTSLHPAPVRNAHDEPFWAAASRGVLAIKACSACDQAHWYPRAHCPFCGSQDTVWRDTDGRGRVYSFSIVARGKRPSAVAVVELDAGPKLTTLIVDADVHSMRIGDAVVVRFEPAEDDTMIPVFTTDDAERAREYSARTLAESASTHQDMPALSVTTAAIVGAGAMGIGIAKAFLKGGVQVVVIDPDESARERASEELATFSARQRDLDVHLPDVDVCDALDRAASADIVLEAVFEDLALKQRILGSLDDIVSSDAILATNTSTLDIDAIASATKHPDRVVGMHFFNPAHVMRLVEVVRGRQTDPSVVHRTVELARRLGKTPVVVGVCPGFAANRMMIARNQEAEQLLLEGSTPEQVDRTMRQLGLPMGPFEMLDMGGGIEVNVRRRQATGEPNWIIDALFERGRLGQKTGAGFYRYAEGDRTPRADPVVIDLIEEASGHAGVERRRIPDSEVRERLLERIAREGSAILAEGIVSSPGDLDVIWREGFGWPDWSGGPLYVSTHRTVDRTGQEEQE